MKGYYRNTKKRCLRSYVFGIRGNRMLSGACSLGNGFLYKNCKRKSQIHRNGVAYVSSKGKTGVGTNYPGISMPHKRNYTVEDSVRESGIFTQISRAKHLTTVGYHEPSASCIAEYTRCLLSTATK
jgi:hypothetical protein